MNTEAAALLARFDVNVDVREPLERFSTAIQQMVAIARAVSFDARLVIMDEPTSSLDEAEVSVLLRTIRQLKAEGVAVIFVSHKLDELYEVCDRVTIMRDGRTVAVSEIKLHLEASAGCEHAWPRSRRSEEARARRPSKAAAARSAASCWLPTTFQSAIGFTTPVSTSAGARSLALPDFSDPGARRRPGPFSLPTGRPPAASRSMVRPRTTRDRPRRLPQAWATARRTGRPKGIVPGMTVAENLTLALMPALTRSGMLDEARQREVVERFIKEIGIKCSGPNQKIRELSGGNQQKVLLARWLCMNPKLLILDEPTRGIDVGAKAEIQNLIRRLAERRAWAS